MTDLPTRPIVRPRIMSWVTGVVIGAASVNALIGLLFVVQIPQAQRAVVLRAAQQHVHAPAPAIVAGSLIFAAVVAVLYGAILVLLVFRLRAGRTWARSVLFAGSLLSLFALFGLNGPAVAVILLLAVADFLMFRPQVTAWLRRRSGLPPV